MENTPHLNCTHCPKCETKMTTKESRSHTSYGFSTSRRRRVCPKCDTCVVTVEVPIFIGDEVFEEA